MPNPHDRKQSSSVIFLLKIIWVHGFRYGFLEEMRFANAFLSVSGPIGFHFSCEDADGIATASATGSAAYDQHRNPSGNGEPAEDLPPRRRE
jgi:hypothetical protein